MKLEMVTIIACEVDTEVFTSDKMQVNEKEKMHVASTPGCCVWLCSSFALRTDRLACCPVQVHAWWRWMQLSLSLSFSGEDFFLSMGAAARPVPRARTVIDAGWIAEMRYRQRQEWDTRSSSNNNNGNNNRKITLMHQIGCVTFIERGAA